MMYGVKTPKRQQPEMFSLRHKMGFYKLVGESMMAVYIFYIHFVHLCVCVCRDSRFCPHQSLCHGGLILSGEVLLQGQDNTVSGDGGQDHVLKWCKGR